MTSSLIDIRMRDDFRYCQEIAKQHYENFSVVSALIPKELRPHFSTIYAFCRGVDDLGDEFEGDRLQALGKWRHELESAFNGSPIHPVFRALSDTVHRFKLDHEEFEKLIRANEIDQESRRFLTIEDTLNYCRHSADPVGRLVLGLFEISDETSYKLSDATCTGLQLVNFLQDTAEDLKRGRSYWPEDDLRKFGLSTQAITDYALHGSPDLDTESISAWGSFEADRIRAYFAEGSKLEDLVPYRLGLQLKAYRLGGEAVLEAMNRQQFNPFLGRPQVSKIQKLQILIRIIAISIGSTPRNLRGQLRRKVGQHIGWGDNTTTEQHDQTAEQLANVRIAESYEECTKRVRDAGSSFYYGMRMLPARKRSAIFAVYAWSRICDDAVDEYAGEEALEQLAKAEQLYEQARSDNWMASPDPVSVALGDAIRRFDLSDEPFRALVHGMRTDLDTNTYDTYKELEAYCLDVAGAVGILCIEIFGSADTRTRELAAKLGVAMQITNIIRDLKEDAERERCYLPREDMEKFEVTLDEVLAAQHSQKVIQLLEFEAERAEYNYREASALFQMIDHDSVRCLKLLYGVYHRILQKIKVAEFDVWRTRVSVGKGEVLRIFGRTFWPVKT